MVHLKDGYKGYKVPYTPHFRGDSVTDFKEGADKNSN